MLNALNLIVSLIGSTACGVLFVQMIRTAPLEPIKKSSGPTIRRRMRAMQLAVAAHISQALSSS